MSDELTEQELAEMEARCNKTVPGPWFVEFSNTVYPLTSVCRMPGHDGCAVGSVFLLNHLHEQWWMDDHAEFIAHARTDIPRLIAEVRSLQKQLDDLIQAGLERWDD